MIVNDLRQLEEILVGIVDAGGSRIYSVVFQSTALKTQRAEARRQAVIAAREKAELYCAAAGVKLGNVIHIEDADPDQVRRFYTGHDQAGELVEDSDIRTFDPSSITVTGAVIMVFTLQR